MEWQATRTEQDLAYRESLAVDRLKVGLFSNNSCVGVSEA